MSNKTTIEIPIELLEDLSSCAEVLFSILRTKPMNEEEAGRLKYALKLLESCNELFPKNNDND